MNQAFASNILSPAFGPYLAEKVREDDKCEALIIYKPEKYHGPRVRGRLRALKARLDLIANKGQSLRSLSSQTGVTSIGGGILPVVTMEISPSKLPELAAQPDVVAILPNQRIHLLHPKSVKFTTPQQLDKEHKLTWGLRELEAPDLWRITKGRDINVAVLDTGVYGAHPVLKDRVKDFVIIDSLGRRITADPSFDCSRHGTHVCGTIAGGETSEGVAIGVAPESRLIVAGVLVGDATIRTLLEGIAWAIEKEADIINMSLGFSYYEPLFNTVFDILMDTYGVIPVVAVGNENHGNTSSPGSAHSALSVGSLERSFEERRVAFYSSGASMVFPGEDPHRSLVHKPDIVAPGSNVYSCIPPEHRADGTYEYSYMDGSSMAAPHVAGAVALLMSAKPEVPAPELVQALKESAEHPGGALKRPDNRWGYGRIRPLEALRLLGHPI